MGIVISYILVMQSLSLTTDEGKAIVRNESSCLDNQDFVFSFFLVNSRLTTCLIRHH